jgi:cytochrome c553
MRGCLILLLAASLIGAAPTMAEEPTPEQTEFFEKRIRPLIVTHCSECHGEGRAKGGLRLTSGESLRRGGDSGAAIVPGKPEESLLIEAIGHHGDIKMPPKEKLADSEIADLRRWIEIGAPWPAENAEARPAAAPFTITPEQRAFWSFQPLPDGPAPVVKDSAWPAGTIDRFILARLEVAGLTLSPPADKRTLIRRVTYDLIGLPATAEEIEAFVADDSVDAWERLVDRLLASPHYGERWARHWLDVARFGEDQAHTFQARVYPSGFRYRDWVVRAFNDDLPFDQFVMEQIAGDLLPGPEAEKGDRQIALGYFALGPVYYADAGCAFKASLDELDDRIDTLARGFLGLTIACARCHDHKFDPISQQDYYALAGIFKSSAYREEPLVPPEIVEKYEQVQKEIKEQEQKIKKRQEAEAVRLAEEAARRASRYLAAAWRLAHPPAGAAPLKREEIAVQEQVRELVLDRWQTFLVPENRAKLPQLAAYFELADQAATLSVAPDGKDVPGAVVEAALVFEGAVQSAFAERDALERRHAESVAAVPEAEKSKIAKPALAKEQADLLAEVAGPKGLCAILPDKIEGLLDDARKAELAALKLQLEAAKKAAPPKYPFAHSLVDGQPGNMKIHLRGNPNRTGDEVPRRFLAVLSPAEPAAFTQGSGRLELARAIASPDNPLTARVIVNRLWQHHFGRGIVGTPSNFGALGERPTHPGLLDYLARRLIAQGWSLKALHREIVLSATYCQSSGDDPASANVDPDNHLLWRMNRRRLDVEAWRDSLLCASGSLDAAIGGPSGNLATADFRRRTLYGAVSRHNLDGLLRLFDFPDPNITSERRTVTTVPLQQLFVLNSDFLVRQAQALAGRVAASGSSADDARVRQTYRLLFGREATESEVQWGVEFLTAPDASEGDGTPADGASPAKSALTRWEQYAQVLLSANEFTFVD